jgi:hypothetical protein
MATTRRTKKAMPLRPISTVCRRYATASFSVGTFSSSEGYEIIRTCYDDMVQVRYHIARHGSAFGAEPRQDSMAKGREVLASIATDLVAIGYAVENDGEFVLRVKATQ